MAFFFYKDTFFGQLNGHKRLSRPSTPITNLPFPHGVVVVRSKKKPSWRREPIFEGPDRQPYRNYKQNDMMKSFTYFLTLALLLLAYRYRACFSEGVRLDRA
jgi:hypothetical protein